MSGPQAAGTYLGLDGEDAPLPGHAFEGVVAAVDEGLPRADAEVADGAADEDLAGSGEAADTRADVDSEAADIVVGEQFAFTGVQPRADLQVDVAGAVSDRGRAADRAARTVEQRQRAVAE